MQSWFDENYYLWILLNQLCMTSLFTKRERSLIFSSHKKSILLKLMLLLNFPIWWSSNWKKILNIIIWFFIQCYYLVSKMLSIKILHFLTMPSSLSCGHLHFLTLHLGLTSMRAAASYSHCKPQNCHSVPCYLNSVDKFFSNFLNDQYSPE